MRFSGNLNAPARLYCALERRRLGAWAIGSREGEFELLWPGVDGPAFKEVANRSGHVLVNISSPNRDVHRNFEPPRTADERGGSQPAGGGTDRLFIKIFQLRLGVVVFGIIFLIRGQRLRESSLSPSFVAADQLFHTNIEVGLA